jgi:hypothetical protein
LGVLTKTEEFGDRVTFSPEPGLGSRDSLHVFVS